MVSAEPAAGGNAWEAGGFSSFQWDTIHALARNEREDIPSYSAESGETQVLLLDATPGNKARSNSKVII